MRKKKIILIMILALSMSLVVGNSYAKDKDFLCPEGQVSGGHDAEGDPICVVDDNTDTLADLSCATDQIAKFDGSEWVCANDETGSASMSKPIIWSGYCSRDSNSGDQGRYGYIYCTDSLNFNTDTAEKYLSVSDGGVFTVKTPGFYHINARATVIVSAYAKAYLWVNDVTVYISQKKNSDSLNLNTADVDYIWPMGTDDQFRIEYDNYRFLSPQRGGIQVTYMGPLE